MLYLIIQIIAFQALFLMVYDLFLKRETFFNCNRVYLITTAVLSLVLPFIKWPTLKTMTVKDAVIHLPEVFIGTPKPTPTEIFVAEQAGISMVQPEIPIWQIILFLGSVLATAIFLYKIFKIMVLKKRNPKRWHGNVLIVNLLKSSTAFSFFNTIFIGERIPDLEKKTIYKHELIHVNEYHSIDVLFFEMLRIIMWFNPMVYLYQNRIKDLHEFIADSKAAKEQGKTTYYQNLLNQVFDVHSVSITNTFFKKSLIKKRIVMLQKSKSKQVKLLKYGVLIPMVLMMLIYTSIEVTAQRSNDLQTTNVLTEEDENIVNFHYNQISRLMTQREISVFNPRIAEVYDYSRRKYIPTKSEYLKYVAHLRLTGETLKSYQKGKDNSDTQMMRFDSMINFNKSYEAYLEYLKTDEALEQKANADYNRTLRVITNNISSLTSQEHQDAYNKAKDVLTGTLYKKLIISDNKNAIEITKDNYDALVRFFSVKEIKSLLKSAKATNIEIIEIEETDNSTSKVEVPFSVVENVPTTKECADLPTAKERRECVSQFITTHVNKNFNTKVADSLELNGRQRIFLGFTINEEGLVTKVKARAAHEVLEEEAERVIKSLPQFIPGRQKGKTVTVPYALPIVFEVRGSQKINEQNDLDSLSPEERKALTEKYKKEYLERIERNKKRDN